MNRKNKISYIKNDKKAANLFVKSLPREIVNSRFSADYLTGKFSEWEPDCTIIVTVNETPAVLADAVFSEVGDGASASIVAQPGCGGYAPLALAALKKACPNKKWLASVRAPSAGLIALLRRQVDAVYDQFAWDLSRALQEQFGFQPHFFAIQIVATDEMLKKYGLQKMKNIDRSSIEQVLFSGINPLRTSLIGPNGKLFSMQDHFSIIFEFLDIPIDTRQKISRTMMYINFIQMDFQMPDKIIEMCYFPKEMSAFIEKIKNSAPNHPPIHGQFTIKINV